MINFCIFVFGVYALVSIVKMLIEYTLGVPVDRADNHSRRKNIYEKTDSRISVTKAQRTDKAYF